MATKKTMKWLATGGLVIGVALMGGTAGATNMLTTGASCTTLDCKSRLIEGSVSQFGASAQPWVAELYAPAGACLRIAVKKQGDDLIMVVRAPNGEVYKNNDSLDGACLLCPLVKIGNTPTSGWYTVSLSHHLGSAVSVNFKMRFQRYPLGNPNCASPTSPLSSLEPDHEKPQAEVPVAPQAGQPGAQ